MAKTGKDQAQVSKILDKLVERELVKKLMKDMLHIRCHIYHICHINNYTLLTYHIYHYCITSMTNMTGMTASLRAVMSQQSYIL